MDQGRYAAQIIAKLEGVVANALLQERRRWAESYQALQSIPRSPIYYYHDAYTRAYPAATNRALWLKRKAESGALDSRPAKLSRHREPSLQGFAPPTPNSSRALSADVDDEVEGLKAVTPLAHTTLSGPGVPSLDSRLGLEVLVRPALRHQADKITRRNVLYIVYAADMNMGL
ncbi:hypothetical protein FRC06_006703 [Ceratobasidium sp. 370]|nr:hypothetical protein FRC06_006703 [Ceratobasidium sp. 370]